jgi:NTP pyrophosphatase (non-canonical NTP hydrolase)
MLHSPHTLAPLVHDYHSLELQAHISIDDVVAKVSEELYELESAIRADDAIEISSEAQDVLTNIVSVSARLVDMADLSIVENQSDRSI